MTGKTMAGYTFANGVRSFKTKDSRYKRPAWLFFPHFLIKTVIGLTRRCTVRKAQFLSSAHIHYNRVQPYSVGCIKIKGAVKVSLTVLQRAKRENEHMGIIELWVKTAEANQVWFPQCSGGLIEKQKVSDSVQFSQSVDSLSPENSAKTHAVEYEGEHLQKHKTPGFSMVTKMFHVSLLLMPKREEVMGVGVWE